MVIKACFYKSAIILEHKKIKNLQIVVSQCLKKLKSVDWW